MTEFFPRRTYRLRHFDIRHDRHGHWTANDREGLVGGTFVSRQDAMRFVVFEAGGNPAYIHEARKPLPRGRSS